LTHKTAVGGRPAARRDIRSRSRGEPAMTRRPTGSCARRRPRAPTLFAATLVAAGACVWHAIDRQGSALNVVIVTLDTTRADRLSPYGLMDVSMPALDRLARERVVFEQATSVAPLTLAGDT